jgi:hypothetical protein
MMSQPDTAEPVPRCPKCKSTTFTAFAHELCEASAAVTNGVVIDSWASSSLPQRQACFGECRCGHKWRFRDMWAVQ